jgi:triacylglycerol lipase
VTERSRSKWFLQWLASSPSRWLGRSSSVAQDLTGGSHGLSYLRHLARGNSIPAPALYESVGKHTRPLLLIHGFLGTRGSMYPLERRLLSDGFCVLSFNLGTLNTRDIRRSSFLIHRKIERVLAQTSWDEIDIVGHSMGGLIGLYYVKKLGGHARVRKLVMMGTPVRGTWSALLGIASLGLYSTSSWQLLPRSRFLDELSQGPLPHGVDLYTIAAARDWVCPPASTRIPGAKATTVPLGHSSLVVSDEVYTRLKHILSSDTRRRDDDEFANDEFANDEFADGEFVGGALHDLRLESATLSEETRPSPESEHASEEDDPVRQTNARTSKG